MGKKKIRIEKIENNRQRQLTFYKRRNGLIKKAMELSLLCNSQILLCIVENNKTVLFSSSSNAQAIVKDFITPSIESNHFITNENYLKFSKKELKDLDAQSIIIEKPSCLSNINTIFSKNDLNVKIDKETHSNSSDSTQISPVKINSSDDEFGYQNISNKEIKKRLVFKSTSFAKEPVKRKSSVFRINFDTEHETKKEINLVENLKKDRTFSNNSSSSYEEIKFTGFKRQRLSEDSTDLSLASNNSNKSSFDNLRLPPKTVPIRKVIDNEKNITQLMDPQTILREKLKKDFFGADSNLSLEQMLFCIKMEMIKKMSKDSNQLKPDNSLNLKLKETTI